MKKIKGDVDDPVVTQVRAWRAKLLKEAGGTIKGLLQLLKEERSTNGRPSPNSNGHRKSTNRKRHSRSR